MLNNLINITYRGYRRYRSFRIRPTDIVLDIGPGDHPFFRADILLDLYVEGLPKDERPFVQADICALPFYDKSIDFIYCHHVLEHVDDPEKALNEFQRVSHRGYIGTPSSLGERLFGLDPAHKWLVEQDKGELIFTPKDDTFFLHAEIARALMQELFKAKPKVMRSFYYGCSPLWGIEYRWSENIYFKINPGAPAEMRRAALFSTVPHPKSMITNLRNFAWNLARWYLKLKRRSRRIDLASLLRCPLCEGKLYRTHTGDFCCQGCNAGFPVKGTVIKMLPSPGDSKT